MALLSGFRDVLVAIVVSMPGSLVLEVFFVIVSLIILPTGWFSLGY
jgi:hypothetical protein